MTRWGGAILELAHFKQGAEAIEFVEEAISKFKQAIAIDAARHDAYWCLGNGYISQGFLASDADSAAPKFTQATQAFAKAVDLDPSNDTYKKALDMSDRAPGLYEEMQRHIASQAFGGGGGGGGSSSGGGGGGGGSSSSQQGASKRRQFMSDSMYDYAGWGVLGALCLGIAALSARAGPMAPPA
jgi:tetratricopeptide (TPR) repeat protein